MKTIIFIICMMAINSGAETMNEFQARAKLAQLLNKPKKTAQDIKDIQQALDVVANAWAKGNR